MFPMHRFYLTYEELKQCIFEFGSYIAAGFYLTYEELKLLQFLSHKRQKEARFYLTYEELKLIQLSVKNAGIYMILSYLWGIETWDDFPILNKVVKILSYLWGIETANFKGY